MSPASSFLKSLSSRQVLKGLPKLLNRSCHHSQAVRSFADKPKSDPLTDSKKVTVQGTENEQRLRVRRARATDVPRVLRFVREHASLWPGPPSQPASHLILGDYVARALAQGHSMLAEQHETRRGWSQIRGLALGAAVCPWDAALLERWARCVRCPRSRRMMHFTAHCLRAPALHDKYRVHNILQVILIVPVDTPTSAEIVHVLAKNTIARGREEGFPLLRFDVTSDSVAKALEELNLTKEWQLSYDVLPETMSEVDSPQTETAGNASSKLKSKLKSGNFIAVYTALTNSGERMTID